jgi:hypothetical protein
MNCRYCHEHPRFIFKNHLSNRAHFSVCSCFEVSCSLCLMSDLGHESCVELLLEHESKREFVGNPFSPLHCAVLVVCGLKLSGAECIPQFLH